MRVRLCGIGILPMIHGLEAHATVESSARIKSNPYETCLQRSWSYGMFDISFTGETVDDEGMTLHLGIMTLGAIVEGFTASFSFWSERDYQRQWIAGAERLLEPDSHSAFITHLDDPATESVINWWPAWRIGNLIILQNQLLFPGAKPGDDEYNPLTARFSLEDPYTAVGDRDSGHTEECQRTNICRRPKLGSRETDGDVCCSEWCVDVEAIKDFLERRVKDWT